MKKKLVSVIVVTKDREQDLEECIKTIFNSSYAPIEVIVVDNASKIPVSSWLKRKHPGVMVVRNTRNLGAAEGRNIGITNAKGSYLLFMDDDAYADKNMIRNLVSVLEEKKNVGIVQPLVYDKENPSMLQGAGHGINLLTGRLYAWGVKEIDKGQYNSLREIPMAGCVWMASRELIDKIGGYDSDYFIPYEDSDFSQRAREAGYKVYCAGNAKAWHRGAKKTYVNPLVEWLGITSPERAFRVSRNKTIFMYKHAPSLNFIIYIFMFLPIYTAIHSVMILITGRGDILANYLRGMISGIRYVLTKTYMSLLIFVIAWTEPIGWIIDKSAKTILDVGCGTGLPMRLIKLRMKPRKTVGVDLFEPYIEEARKERIHSEYIVTDIRKLPFKNRSFDVVIGLQILEHLPKEDAWKVLEKMERIAKKQVIIATPIGELFHPPVDNNLLQLHKSSFKPDEFKKRGYKILKMGKKSLFGEEGYVHKAQSGLARKMFYFFNFLLTPFFYLFQSFPDYHLYAYKSVERSR